MGPSSRKPRIHQRRLGIITAHAPNLRSIVRVFYTSDLNSSIAQSSRMPHLCRGSRVSAADGALPAESPGGPEISVRVRYSAGRSPRHLLSCAPGSVLSRLKPVRRFYRGINRWTDEAMDFAELKSVRARSSSSARTHATPAALSASALASDEDESVSGLELAYCSASCQHTGDSADCGRKV